MTVDTFAAATRTPHPTVGKPKARTSTFMEALQGGAAQCSGVSFAHSLPEGVREGRVIVVAAVSYACWLPVSAGLPGSSPDGPAEYVYSPHGRQGAIDLWSLPPTYNFDALLHSSAPTRF